MKLQLAAVAVSAWCASAQLKATDFEPYPGYNGDLTVTGEVYIGEVRGQYQVIFARLKGVDGNCTGVQTGANNSCGIHVHSGTTCADAKGHFWDETTITDDPLKNVTYTDVTEGQAAMVEGIVVRTDKNLVEMEKRAFVVHDSKGARVACCLLENAAGEEMFKVEKFEKYPTDTGTEVIGTLSVRSVDNVYQVLQWDDLKGLDDKCAADVTIDKKNGCGIHIHEGTSCLTDALVGGHHWNKEDTTDPWLKITYRNGTKGVTIPVGTNLTMDKIYGRTVVIHDKEGGRMACGRIVLAENAPLKTKGFATYFNFEGVGENTTGTVRFGHSTLGKGTQVIFADLMKADPTCNLTQDGTKNECGLHFHSGTNCTSNTGGHFFNSVELGSNDPWINKYNTTTKDGDHVTEVNQHVTTAYTLDKFETRVFVIHNAESKRSACSAVERVSITETLTHDVGFSKYPGSSTALNVTGYVGVYQVDVDTQFLQYSLSGLDLACTAEYDQVKNGCGLHIHKGVTCASAADVGGHHYDDSISDDPWLPMRYVADSSGTFSGTTVAIKTGIPIGDLYGRALVVHDSSGGRVACTLIQAKQVDPSPAPSPPGVVPSPAPSPPAAPSPGTTAAPSPATTEAADGGLPVPALIGVAILVLALCGGGGYFYMNQEGGGHEQFQDAPEVEMEEAAQEE